LRVRRRAQIEPKARQRRRGAKEMKMTSTSRAVFVMALCFGAGCEETDPGKPDSSTDPIEQGDAGAQQDAAMADAGGSAPQDGAAADSGGTTRPLGFFVSSETNPSGNLGGLPGADARCQRLAAAVGAGGRTWRAYLSADPGSDGGAAVNARDRIGSGPWYNAKGALVAQDLAALHALSSGAAELFLDERGEKIKGQWEGSGTPIEHDILTGSDADGRVLAGKTCNGWTSADASLAARVGHSDGLGPMRNPEPPYNSWNSSHDNAGCNDTAPRGGAGRIYCFAAD
jgi:hypothetical protein